MWYDVGRNRTKCSFGNIHSMDLHQSVCLRFLPPSVVFVDIGRCTCETTYAAAGDGLDALKETDGEVNCSCKRKIPKFKNSQRFICFVLFKPKGV